MQSEVQRGSMRTVCSTVRQPKYLNRYLSAKCRYYNRQIIPFLIKARLGRMGRLSIYAIGCAKCAKAH